MGTPDRFDDLPILGELRDALDARFSRGRAAAAVVRSCPRLDGFGSARGADRAGRA